MAMPYYINALDSGRYWGPIGLAKTLTYSFATSPTGSETGFQLYSAEQQAAVRLALSKYSEIANLTFVEVTDSKNVQLRFFRDDLQSEYPNSSFAGYAWYPDNGDVHINSAHQYTDFGTLLHEIGHALSLKHPFETEDNRPVILTGAEDSKRYTVMSYTVDWDLGNVSGTYFPVPATTPMLYDIQAIQYLYGKNMTTRTGNDTYRFSTTASELKTIWDAGGIDTFDLSEQSYDMQINLNEAQFSSLGVKQRFDEIVGVPQNNIAIAYGVIIENAIGGNGNDRLLGNQADNNLQGGIGNDSLTGDAGSDILDGGDGIDTSVYLNSLGSYQFGYNPNNKEMITIKDIYGNEGIDNLWRIETFKFLDKTIALPNAFNSLQYIASNQDLIKAFGANIDLGLTHYIQYGFQEDRITSSFNPLEYIASNTDLLIAFGTNTDAALTHYIQAGFFEERTTSSFNPLEYIASNTDLLIAFGTNIDAALAHYIQAGFFEGRATSSFDPVWYLAKNIDLRLEYGNNESLALTHYIEFGFNEGRTTDPDGNDKLVGSDFSDTISGYGGNDILNGKNGDDLLYGLNGNDKLVGNLGKDSLIGGKGADKFKFESIRDSGLTDKTRDMIVDFSRQEKDKIDFSGIDANTTTAKDDAFLTLDIGTNDRIFKVTNALYFNSATYILYGNNDTDPQADFSILFSGVTNLTASDFIL